MNIFVTHPDPSKSAENLPDTLVNKMLVESCQILAVVMWDLFEKRLPKKGEGFYSIKNHKNHPAVLWAKADLRHLKWLVDHTFKLSWEFKKRFGKETHGTDKALMSIQSVCSSHRISLPDTYYDIEKWPKVINPEVYPSINLNMPSFYCYRKLGQLKGWGNDYKRLPNRKPDWI